MMLGHPDISNGGPQRCRRREPGNPAAVLRPYDEPLALGSALVNGQTRLRIADRGDLELMWGEQVICVPFVFHAHWLTRTSPFRENG